MKLYIKPIEVEIEEKTINSYVVLNEEYYKEQKNKKEFQEVETELSFETAFMYPEYLIIDNNVLKLHNVKELKKYTYRLFILENKIDVGINWLQPGYYPVDQVNHLVSFTVDEELNETNIEILLNQFIIIKKNEVFLKKDTANVFRMKERTNLWEEKEIEKLRNR